MNAVDRSDQVLNIRIVFQESAIGGGKLCFSI